MKGRFRTPVTVEIVYNPSVSRMILRLTLLHTQWIVKIISLEYSGRQPLSTV